jgi:hypothetical protein
MNDNLSFNFLYAKSADFRLTEFGWGFFLHEEIELKRTLGPIFNLPVTTNENSNVSRVHLWKPETKGLCFIIHSLSVPEECWKVPVQYSAGGGTYQVSSAYKVPIFNGKEFIINGFADTVMQDEPGFV